MKIFFLILVLLVTSGIIQSISAEENISFSDTGHHSDKTTILMYIVGSTLEADPKTPDYHGATNDMKEMIDGYSQGHTDLGVYVAYGGARKEGWVGIRYATLEQIKKDIEEDDVIGNSEDTLYHNPDENMADPRTLSSFITYVQDAEPESRKLLFFWNHGEAWNGFGIDSNFGNDRLSLEEIHTALSETGQEFDLIGFDACLMANLEVAKTLSPFGKTMVASEDLEPGFGWDWKTVFEKLITQPDIDPHSLGRIIVDAYIDNPRHTDEGKTMSVLDLTKTNAVVSSFEIMNKEISGGLNDEIRFRQFSKAILQLSPFNQMITKGGEISETSVDLKDMVHQISESSPELHQYTSQVNESLNTFIVYNRHDRTRPAASGVSVYSPYRAILADENREENQPKVFLEFTDLLQSLIHLLKKTHLTSLIKEEKSGYTIPEGEVVDVRLKFIQKDAQYDIILGEEPAYPDKQGHYPLPVWGGWGLQWIDEKNGNKLPVPLYFIGYTDKGRERYKAYAKVNRGNIVNNLMFDLYYNPVTGEVAYYLLPYYFEETGHAVIEKKVFTLIPGDTLTMIARISDIGKEKEVYIDYGSIDWTDSVSLQYDMLPCDTDYSMVFTVYNIAKKIVFSDEKEVFFECANSTPD
jgi:hypothetical protein